MNIIQQQTILIKKSLVATKQHKADIPKWIEQAQKYGASYYRWAFTEKQVLFALESVKFERNK